MDIFITPGYKFIVNKYFGNKTKVYLDNVTKSVKALKKLGLDLKTINDCKKELKEYCNVNLPPNFKKIEEYPLYAIRKDGVVIRIDTRTLPKKFKSSGGYIKIELKVGDSWRDVNLHILLAKAFKPNPDNKPIVNHKDGDKTNYKLSNLEWVTVKENSSHAIDKELSKPYGSDNGNAKLTDKEVIKIFKSTSKLEDIAKEFNIGLTTVKGIRNGSKWTKLLKEKGLI